MKAFFGFWFFVIGAGILFVAFVLYSGDWAAFARDMSEWFLSLTTFDY